MMASPKGLWSPIDHAFISAQGKLKDSESRRSRLQAARQYLQKRGWETPFQLRWLMIAPGWYLWRRIPSLAPWHPVVDSGFSRCRFESLASLAISRLPKRMSSRTGELFLRLPFRVPTPTEQTAGPTGSLPTRTVQTSASSYHFQALLETCRFRRAVAEFSCLRSSQAIAGYSK